MSTSSKRATARQFTLVAAMIFTGALGSAPAAAHGVIGPRFFPATITSDDPFAADELALPTITSFDHETDLDFDYSKSIFPGFAIGVGIGHVSAKSAGEPRAQGFGNLEISPALELYRNAAHEFIFTTGLDWEIGGTGSKAVAERSSTYTPTIKFGKGFGDLPDGLKYLRPLAVTGTVGYAIPGASDRSRSVEWGGAIEYSLLYLQNNVRDEGFSNFVAHLTPVAEFTFSSPTGQGDGGTTGTINPGLIWSGQYVQVAAEAMIPVNHASGHGIGFIAQLHFYIDDIFPNSLGRPIFGGRR
ncbi:MAG TPA: hypothetical protein VE221_06940 [Sphingomicrobium sp.]|nr:hypothetical protein [Sphingomicrobium sp.]